MAWADPLEKGMSTHSSILAWRIPWTEDPGRLQSTGSQSRTRLSDYTLQLATLGLRAVATGIHSGLLGVREPEVPHGELSPSPAQQHA